MEKKTLGEPRQGGWKSGCDLGTKVLTAKKKKKKKSSCPTQPCHGGGLKVPFGNECNVSCEPSCSPGNYCFFTFVWQEASGRISMGEQFPVCMTDCSERKGQIPPPYTSAPVVQWAMTPSQELRALSCGGPSNHGAFMPVQVLLLSVQYIKILEIIKEIVFNF